MFSPIRGTLKRKGIYAFESDSAAENNVEVKLEDETGSVEVKVELDPLEETGPSGSFYGGQSPDENVQVKMEEVEEVNIADVTVKKYSTEASMVVDDSFFVGQPKRVMKKKLTIFQKKKIIEIFDSLCDNDRSYRKMVTILFDRLGISVSYITVRNIIRSRDKIESTPSSSVSRRTIALANGVNAFVTRLFQVVIAESFHGGIRDEVMKEIAFEVQKDEFGDDEEVQKLKFSKNWINYFKKDHNLKQKGGKKNFVDEVQVELCRSRIRRLMELYDPMNILNFDETRFEWKNREKMPADSGRLDRGAVYSSGCFISASGIVSHPIFISDTFPRNMFSKSSKISTYSYDITKGTNNPKIVTKTEQWRKFMLGEEECFFAKTEKGWNTRHLMSEVLVELNNQFCVSGRHVLLLMDTAICHSHLEDISPLSNIRLEYFCPYATSVVQPTDMNVFNLSKRRYRKWLLRRNSIGNSKPDRKESIENFARMMLDISPSQIQKCWQMAGLAGDDPVSPTDREIMELNEAAREEQPPVEGYHLDFQRLRRNIVGDDDEEKEEITDEDRYIPDMSMVDQPHVSTSNIFESVFDSISDEEDED